MSLPSSFFFFFFNDTATTEIYTLSLHDALPISLGIELDLSRGCRQPMLHRIGTEGRQHDRRRGGIGQTRRALDRKSTRLNSSHLVISYAVFCLKKKKNKT